MSQTRLALGWAAAVIGAALAQRIGLIGSDAGRLFILVLPIMAVLSIYAGRRCQPSPQGGAGR